MLYRQVFEKGIGGTLAPIQKAGLQPVGRLSTTAIRYSILKLKGILCEVVQLFFSVLVKYIFPGSAHYQTPILHAMPAVEGRSQVILRKTVACFRWFMAGAYIRKQILPFQSEGRNVNIRGGQ